jgi:hypothetical protein
MNEPDDMELKRALDALPRAIEPPVDAWTGIRARLKKRGTMGRRSLRPALRIAALLTLLAISAAALAITRRGATTWRLASADGRSRVLAVGESLATAGPAQVTVGRIGHLEVTAGTSLRLLAARVSEQRLALTRGTIHAEISAPPRLFIVETPSGTAVDLGCAYTLDVDSAGTSTLVVTAGWVAFEDHGIESLVPAGMRAVAHRGAGIGTPMMEDAPESLRTATAAFDVSRADSSLGMILRSARRRDAVTLWHLVKRTEGAQRGRLVTKLVALVPLPAGIDRAAIERAEPRAMELYWTELPGTLPIVPSWQQTLWKLWLRVGA